MKKRYSEEQIIKFFFREADAKMSVKDLCRRHGLSEPSYYLWRSKFRYGRVGRQAVEGAGDGERPPQEAVGRVVARTKGDPRGITKKMVSAPARRNVLVKPKRTLYIKIFMVNG